MFIKEIIKNYVARSPGGLGYSIPPMTMYIYDPIKTKWVNKKAKTAAAILL